MVPVLRHPAIVPRTAEAGTARLASPPVPAEARGADDHVRRPRPLSPLGRRHDRLRHGAPPRPGDPARAPRALFLPRALGHRPHPPGEPRDAGLRRARRPGGHPPLPPASSTPAPTSPDGPGVWGRSPHRRPGARAASWSGSCTWSRAPSASSAPSRPALLYAPGARAPGPLFVPITRRLAVAFAALIVWLARAALAASGTERRRRAALAVGGGLRIAGRRGRRRPARLRPGRRLAGGALPPRLHRPRHVCRAQRRARPLARRRTAGPRLRPAHRGALVGRPHRALPAPATPRAGRREGRRWTALVIFFAALPLDPVGSWWSRTLGRRLFANPIGVRDLADQVERTEVARRPRRAARRDRPPGERGRPRDPEPARRHRRPGQAAGAPGRSARDACRAARPD